MPAPAKNPDLHGNVPDSSPIALVLIDVINDLEFDEGARLLEQALPMAERLAALKRRAVAAGVPVIYANDNFGRWRSEQAAQLDHCLKDGVRGEPLARLLKPEERDYYVVKPKHSAFYGTTFDVLLDYLGARTLILTGLTGDRCVLFTANDAFLRDFELVVPRDCVASIDPQENEHALRLMQRVLDARICDSRDVDLSPRT
jgi:nicotinamidase-related amidase